MHKALFVSLQLSFGTLGCLYTSPLLAQIASDGTVNTIVNQNGNVAEITGGETRGSNLFHSFQDFSVPTNNEAFFNNANDISNIFSRVTGGNISNINGLIRANGSASLFLINPAGIIFGNNARLDIGGSFYSSTASSILFEDGEFSAVDNLAQPILTINAPIGLNFRDEPGEIVNRSTANNIGLQVAPGETIGLIGGDIKLEGGLITAPGGRVELGGLSTAGSIDLNENLSLSFSEVIERADISLTEGAAVNVRAGGGGSIDINARNLTLSDQSELFAGIAENMGSENAQAGDITINATESVRLLGQPRQAPLSDIDPITTERDLATGIRNNVGLSSIRRNNSSGQSNALGNGGNIEIDTKTLSLSNVAVIDTSVFGEGDGGNITINSDEVVLDQGVLLSQIRGFNTEVIQEQGNGNAGNIFIDTQSLSLTDAALILADVQQGASGSSGNVVIQVSDTFTQNTDSFILTQLGIDTLGMGSAGNIDITAGSYEIGERGTLSGGASLPALQSDSSTGSQGDAGNINIDVENTFSISGNLILSQVQAGAEGNGGDINITAGSFEASNGSLILADTRGQGDAGNIKINVEETIFLDGDGTNVLTELGENVGGNAGDINITANALLIGNSANITAKTKGQGNAGNITITTNGAIDAISLSNDAKIISTVEGTATGNGGSISLNSGELNLTNNAEIVADTAGEGNAGNINIDVVGNINLNNSTQIQSQTRGGAEGNAGNITIETDGSLFSTNGNFILADSQAKGDGGSITITAGQQILLEGLSEDGLPSQIVAGLSRENSEGTGGTIEINAGELILDDVAFIASNTVNSSIGAAGNITINVDNLRLMENSFINAFTANDFDGGAITIDAQTLDLASGGKILAATDGGGNAGNINLNISDRLTIDNSVQSSAEFVDFGAGSQLLNDLQDAPSGIYADTTINSTGNGGNVNIGMLPEQAPENLIISNNGQVIVDSQGTGSGGSISIRSQTLELDNGKISASTQAGVGGEITLEIAEDLTLDNGSKISAEAFNDANGGNLNIDARFIIAFPNGNNDILASADEGIGGNININAESLFGIQERPQNDSTNDIDASSEFNLDGNVNLNILNFDPIQGVTELPRNIVETGETVAQACSKDRAVATRNSLTITGKGGAAPSPDLPLNSASVIIDGQVDNSISAIPQPIETSQGKIQPARGIKVTESGEIILTAYRTDNAGNRLLEVQRNCRI
ncbi:MAG: filamentous hemagglutinin N-terminal domain-containing protein [Pleurocapsa sp. MO_226.B13]|nr:filamentous hemagglutinin N-terminal domain-containing protein [Pleurocapsa sp. MO_226.B13]